MVPRQLAFARQLDSFAHLMFNSLIIMLMLLIIIARVLKVRRKNIVEGKSTCHTGCLRARFYFESPYYVNMCEILVQYHAFSEHLQQTGDRATFE
jgi:uncharacterized membrane protein